MRASVACFAEHVYPGELAPRWYACYTRSRHEKKVARLLLERGVESFLPLVVQTRQWKDRAKQVSMVLFPSYVFARVSLHEVSRILAIPGVTAVVRSNGHPAAVSDEELDNVRQLVAVLAAGRVQADVRPLPLSGDRVRITAGPFHGIFGTVIEHRRHCRVIVGLEVIGWGAEVEIESSLLDLA